jgi:hypothetical protein
VPKHERWAFLKRSFQRNDTSIRDVRH